MNFFLAYLARIPPAFVHNPGRLLFQAQSVSYLSFRHSLWLANKSLRDTFKKSFLPNDFETSPHRHRGRRGRGRGRFSLLHFAASKSYCHGYGNQITVTPALHAIGPYPRRTGRDTRVVTACNACSNIVFSVCNSAFAKLCSPSCARRVPYNAHL